MSARPPWRRGAVSTEVALGTENGWVEESVVNALDLVTALASRLTGYQGQLDRTQLGRLDDALRLALGLDEF